MKIYWGLRPSESKVQERIARLERELGLDDQTVLAEVDRNRLKRNAPRGPVILRPKSNPLLLDFRPGQRWPVTDSGAVMPLRTVFTSAAYCPEVYVTPKSRVILPGSVRA